MRRKRNLSGCSIIAVFLLGMAGTTKAVIRRVPDQYPTIQAAINASHNYDTVLVADDTYTGYGNRNISFNGRAITVKSENGPASCIVDSQGHGRVFSFQSGESASSVLDGFTITNGYVTNMHGGGIYCLQSSPTVTNCIFTNNTARSVTTGKSAYGGGMCANSCSPTVTNCVFSQNSGGWGGGMGNIVGGGAIVKNCVFSNNSTQHLGGGMFNNRGNPSVVNCIFTENSGSSGGGIYNSRCSPTFTNCMFSGNSAFYNGGGMSNNESNPRLTNCTISGNDARYGDGIHNNDSSPSLINCIVWGNFGEQIKNGSSTPSITYSNVEGGWAGEGNINADPDFVDADNHDYHLLATSRCMDTGDNGAVDLTTDLDGNARIVNGIVDMGAYEHQGPRQTCLLYVDCDVWGENDGSSWMSAFGRIQDALAVALSGDEIHVAQGIYMPGDYILYPPPPPPFIDRTATFQLKNGVIIKGGYAGFGEPDPNARDIEVYETILSGDLASDDEPNFVNYDENSYHVVTGSGCDETATLDGFTITAGNANGTDCESHGGGMYNNYGSPTVTNCTFSTNWSENFGGGMCNEFTSNPRVSKCTFEENSAGWDGGGMFNDFYSSAIVTNCTFSGNTAHSGGGIFSQFTSNPIVTNCTFAGNSAVDGGGIANGWSSKPTVTNCILWDNTATSGPQMYDGVMSMTVITYSNIKGGWGGEGNIAVEPCFVDPGYWDANGVWVGGDYHLLCDSPCIDTGDPCYVAEPNEKDLDGNSRVIGGRIDMGAYEFFNTPPVADADSEQTVECACNTVEGTKVTLDGSGSYDADGDPLAYTWTGSFVESPANGATPTVTLENGCPGSYVITLIVNDGTEDSEPDTVLITVVDTTPPDINCPADVTLECSADTSVGANGLATATDNCDDSPEILYGDMYYDTCPRVIERTWTATDASGNSSSCVQVITVADTIPPVITCPADVTLECPADTSVEANGSATASDICSSATITHSDAWQAGCGNTGALVRTWTATDECGNSSSCVQVITVVDMTPPEFSLSVSPSVLWPANHKMVLITPSWTVSDKCDSMPEVSLISISVNETDDTKGAGNTADDIQVGDDGSIYLRAERSGAGKDRIYTITYKAVDDCGNSTEISAIVTVPHDQR